MLGPVRELRAGLLLIAQPLLWDPNFRRTVVLLCEHDASGSWGLVLNRRLPITLREAAPAYFERDLPLFYGGPVQPNTLHYVHRYGELMEGAHRVSEGIYWGGSLETLQALLRQREDIEGGLRFFAGYAGWSPGQLQRECERNDWVVMPADSRAVFDLDPERLWRELLYGLGGEYRMLANFPEHPSLN
ncbi:MAG: YqgE/AlgH family protein [Bacteroidetes bacterium]|nr:YqgE/AlgH family protein [Rhodothermia bacterium]MCS7155831.1 YqgE/AlgH family protein [Bacteroidota bacterium]MCX7906068.1 YqgE/AlgH family protein [Bacteroidota bacterium]MDW8138196.1 YqgE/AlgH family protein [Bacteroidota bacterium]MDW8285880.1 YqgE/AlgH family protein [Bacteroidota bacterium]